MSRFFNTGGGSDTESESSVSEGEQAQQRAPVAKFFGLSDDEDDVKRVVRSHKDKRFEEIKDAIRGIKNHKKINDIAKVLSDFEQLCKIYLKAKSIIDKEGIPRFYVKYLVELEDYVKELWEDKDTKKKLSKINARALGALRQKMKKYVREFEDQTIKYRENPDVDEDSSESDEDLDESDDDDMDFTRKTDSNVGHSQFLKSGSSESESESDEWHSSTSEEGRSDEEGGGFVRSAGPSMFLKSTAGGSAKDGKKRKGKRSRGTALKDEKEMSIEEEAKLPKDKLSEKALFGKDVDINNETVLQKVREIVSVRGKKGTDRREVITVFKELLAIQEREDLSVALKVKILFDLLSAIYDGAFAIHLNYMKPEFWKMCTEYLHVLIDTLAAHVEVHTGMKIPEESENISDSNLPYQVRGCVVSLMERMDDEFTKILRSCDARSPEYIERLKDEGVVTGVIKKTQKLVEKNNFPPSDVCKVYLRRIEHMYYKYDALIAKSTSKKESSESNDLADDVTPCTEEDTINSKDEMARLCSYIYKRDQTERIRTRAMLCQTYHHAIHDRWIYARDLMLMSHIQESIQYSDIPTQVLYNRTMVQLGLCAFRHGNIKDAHNCLVELQVTNRVRELLAQGFSQRQSDKTKDQEKLERQRQIPFHMHINTELIECCYLTSAMLLEIPYLAAREFDNRRKMISKNFHYHLRNSERQTLVGPPESMREQVIAAAYAMRNGDWKTCSDYVLGIKVWDLFTEPENVKEMLLHKIREESLRTYLFTYGGIYTTLRLSNLSEMFSMDPPMVHRTASRMIMNNELQASWDEPTETIVMHRCEPTKLQNVALQIAEKISALADTNEKILHERHGYNVNKDWREQNRDRRELNRDRRRVQQNPHADDNWSGNKGQGRSGKGSGNRSKRKQGSKGN